MQTATRCNLDDTKRSGVYTFCVFEMAVVFSCGCTRDRVSVHYRVVLNGWPSVLVMPSTARILHMFDENLSFVVLCLVIGRKVGSGPRPKLANAARLCIKSVMKIADLEQKHATDGKSANNSPSCVLLFQISSENC
jgi:hypothetical protein